jgi:mRNA interferase RelE/StbE
MKYTVRLDPRTRKALDRLPDDMRGRVVRKLQALEDDPRPRGVEKLTRPEDLYRVRVGDWRIVYAIHEDIGQVMIVTVAHRREVYR